MLSVVLASLLGACSKDDPFGSEIPDETGKLLTSALDVSLTSDKGPRSLKDRDVRAAAPSANLFKIEISRKNSAVPYVVEYDYSKMPEIVTLPVGDYTVKAFYGDNPDAGWDAPYYEGTADFTIVKDEITDNVDPIECTVMNVRVSIVIDESLRRAITGDYSVNVKVNNVGELDFTATRIDNGESGYFKFVEGSTTLVATFGGIVDGIYSTETRTGIDVRPGHHYIITFRLYDAGEEGPGSIVGGGEEGELIIIHSDVEEEGIIDGTIDADNERPNIDGNDRPTEGQTPEGPGTDIPGTDTPTQNMPSVSVKAPMDIDQENQLKSDSKVEFVVESYAADGISGFKVVIDSNVLDKTELESVGIPQIIDLINCDDELAGSLKAFGFPVQGEVKGARHLEFDINQFVDTLLLLSSFNDAPKKYYNFTLTVTDANGTTEKTLRLYNN